MSVVGGTFIRVRPDTTGFKSETESAVRAGVAGVGKIIAGACVRQQHESEYRQVIAAVVP